MGDEPCRPTKFREIGASTIDCIYQYSIYDPIKDDVAECFQQLQMNNNRSLYRNYNVFRADSVLRSLGNTQLTFREFVGIHNRYESHQTRCGYTVIVKERTNNELKVYDKVFIDNYGYTEPVPSFNWKISSETRIICGYNCTKATCAFRGRQWIAWFTEDIQYMDGPWKFSGLPGLILHVEDQNKEHVISAINIRMCNSDMFFYDRHYIKTTREKFNAELKDFNENAQQYIAGSVAAPKNADGTPARIPKRRMFFNPIELE